ncbi:MAG: hypothetical protein LBS95_01630 [Mycoplasmataceae bacterium]|nr:hypothetical protein [Mycoplasmataceae bacterium]
MLSNKISLRKKALILNVFSTGLLIMLILILAAIGGEPIILIYLLLIPLTWMPYLLVFGHADELKEAKTKNIK